MMLCIVLNTGIGVQSGIHSQDIRRSLTTNFLYHSLSVAGIKSLNDETISSWISGSRDPRARVSVFPISSLCIGSPGPKVYFSWIIFWTVSVLNKCRTCLQEISHILNNLVKWHYVVWHSTKFFNQIGTIHQNDPTVDGGNLEYAILVLPFIGLG